MRGAVMVDAQIQRQLLLELDRLSLDKQARSWTSLSNWRRAGRAEFAARTSRSSLESCLLMRRRGCPTRSRRVASEFTPMIGNYLLDTNVVIAMFTGDAQLRAKLDSTRRYLLADHRCRGTLLRGEELATSCRKCWTSRGLRGGKCCTRLRPGNPREYGTLKALLREAGTPIPDNDLWIAALARQHELTILSRDRHFECVPGIALENW